MGEENQPHPRVALADDLAATLHRHLPHQGHSECLELLGDVLLLPSQGKVTQYTLPSSPRRPRGRAHTITHSLLRTLKCRHCIGSTWSWQVSGVPARALFSSHKSDVSFTFNRKVEELPPRRASVTLHALPSPSNCTNISTVFIAVHHPVGAKPPLCSHWRLRGSVIFPKINPSNQVYKPILNQM